MATPELQTLASLPPGRSLKIQRGELAGWIVFIDRGQMVMGESAAFSNATDLMAWLQSSVDLAERTPG
jgi:hypothetical protein